LDLTLLITLVNGDDNNNCSFVLWGKFLQKQICEFHCLSHGNMLCKGSGRLSWYFLGNMLGKGSRRVSWYFLGNMLCKGSWTLSWYFFRNMDVNNFMMLFGIFMCEESWKKLFDVIKNFVVTIARSIKLWLGTSDPLAPIAVQIKPTKFATCTKKMQKKLCVIFHHWYYISLLELLWKLTYYKCISFPPIVTRVYGGCTHKLHRRHLRIPANLRIL